MKNLMKNITDKATDMASLIDEDDKKTSLVIL